MKYASVTEVVSRIKRNIQRDYWLQSIAMEGSIIGLKRASAGHYYMNIHDDACSIRAILFRSRTGRMMEQVHEGDQVVVIGSVNVYEKSGSISFIIEKIFAHGAGYLQQQYEKIKQELYRAGYFDAEHKKALPLFPWTIGVLTSATGAVLHDIHKIAAERNPYAEIRLMPIPVQGQGAAEKIAQAVTEAGQNHSLDVLILARGGGSLEDLWCFNSPAVVKAIYTAEVPVITAIGHETDTTLADYAADVRAATPTHAAELAFFDVRETEIELAEQAEQAYQLVLRRIMQYKRDVKKTKGQLQTRQYHRFLSLKNEALQHLLGLAQQRLNLKLSQAAGRYQTLSASLQAMNPAVLVRKGYGQLEQNGLIVTDIQKLEKEKPLYIQLIDGKIVTEIKEVTVYGGGKYKTKKL